MKKTSESFTTGKYDNSDEIARLSDCISEQVGYIEILYNIHLPMQFSGEAWVGLDPKLAFKH